MSEEKKIYKQHIENKLQKNISDDEWYSKKMLIYLISNEYRQLAKWWDDKFTDILYLSDNIHILDLLMTKTNISSFYIKELEELWWKPQKFNWEKFSPYMKYNFFEFELLEKYYPDYYKDETILSMLLTNAPKHFTIWWNKISNDYKKILLLYYTNKFLYRSKNIDLWWDKEIIQIKYPLVEYHLYHYVSQFQAKFLDWWDKDKWDYKNWSIILPLYFPEHFDVWFDKKLFNYNQNLTRRLCTKLNIMMFDQLKTCLEEFVDKDNNMLSESEKNSKILYHQYSKAKYILPLTCSKHFDKWWVLQKYQTTISDNLKILKRHCKENIISVPSYIIHNLKGE